MPDISSIGPGSLGPIHRSNGHANHANGVARHDAAAERSSDRVELSDHARFLNRIRELPAVRTDKVESIRNAIENGQYETDDKLDVAIDRLLEDLVD